MRIPVLALLATLTLPIPMLADSITYTYTGSDFTSVNGPYTTADSVTGEFTLSAPLADNLTTLTDITPVSFSFSDGVQTITNLSVTPSYNHVDFEFETDATGDITFWNVEISPAPGTEVVTYSLPGPSDSADIGTFSGSEGATVPALDDWTTTTAVTPEPASLMLVATGLAGALTLRRRRFQRG
jgi:PEP-CTERM motif